MQATVHEIDSFTQRVSFDFSPDQISGLFNSEMKKLKSKVNVPGFRKGKVPAGMLKKRYGQGVLMDIQQDLIQKAWTHVVRELKLEPMSQPELEELGAMASVDGGLSFKFSFDTIPPFELLDASGFELERTEWTCSDEALEARVTEMCEQMGEWVALKRRKKARAQDQVVFSLQALEGDEELSALASEEERVVLGSKTMIPELEEAFVGLKLEEEAKVDYTFPEDHPNDEIKGKTVTFIAAVKEINEKSPLKPEELPEKLNHEGDLDSLKAKLAEEMADERNKGEAQKLRNELAKLMRERYDFGVPPAAVNEQAHHRLHSAHNHAQGEACDHDHSAEEEETAREEAARDLRMEAVLRRHAQESEVTITDREVNDRIFEMLRGAGEFGMQIFQFYQQPQNKARLKESIIEDKVLDKILEGASVKVVSAEIKPEANEADKA